MLYTNLDKTWILIKKKKKIKTKQPSPQRSQKIKEKQQSFSTTSSTKCASMNCKVIHWGTETKILENKRDVLHLEIVEDESGPGHCLTIQLTWANGTGYVSLRCTMQHVFIRGWEVPLIQERKKSNLENTTHSSSNEKEIQKLLFHTLKVIGED